MYYYYYYNENKVSLDVQNTLERNSIEFEKEVLYIPDSNKRADLYIPYSIKIDDTVYRCFSFHEKNKKKR